MSMLCLYISCTQTFLFAKKQYGTLLQMVLYVLSPHQLQLMKSNAFSAVKMFASILIPYIFVHISCKIVSKMKTKSNTKYM